MDSPAMEADGLTVLCTISYESGERHYVVTLAADISIISLEGMKRFHILIGSTHKELSLSETLRTTLEINLREEMNCVRIESEEPRYFTITRKSLDPLDQDIDSSIHEVVDLGLMDLRINADTGDKQVAQRRSLMFDAVAANLVKACVSTLLAQATRCHRQVIFDADHLFANRQDYVREMCRCLCRYSEEMTDSVIGKAIYCEQGIL